MVERILGVLIIVSVLVANLVSIRNYIIEKKKDRLFLAQHNRKAMLGKNEQNWNEDIKEECFHQEDFFRLRNSGTCDISYLDKYEYISFINFDVDMFLED